ncbi:hypothetical protein BKD30_09155 [Tersicoccus phoenicis]|uniref:ATP/GTP-binding protein n=1 Tax=Tersicoccus phoenicis TaxID=554083 RepID=A0A1R1L969_9MICC|nr:hypothetical protein [Tersicoccus phoenicis]OMH24076.1 hypothetical protein BKD30_09155 [Tersicoccus phoenicis]
MPRSNRPSRAPRPSVRRGRRPAAEPRDVEGVLDGVRRTESTRHGAFVVAPVSAQRAVKTYVCPGCGNAVLPGIAHVVAWRADWIMGDEAAAADRRHWHERCWRAYR